MPTKKLANMKVPRTKKRKRIILTPDEREARDKMRRVWYHVRDSNPAGSPEQYCALFIVTSLTNAIIRQEEPVIRLKWSLI